MWWAALIVIGAFALLIGVLVLINQSLAAGIKKNVVEADARAKSRGSVRGADPIQRTRIPLRASSFFVWGEDS